MPYSDIADATDTDISNIDLDSYDPVFEDADEFDPFRENVKDHLTFGKGHHFCPGAPLTRLEGRDAFEELVKRINLPAFSAGNTFEYEPSYVLRGLKGLDLDIEKC